MSIRRWIPHGRKVAFVLTGVTAIAFVASAFGALLWGFVPPHSLQVAGSIAAFAALLAIVILLLVDRRKRDRPSRTSGLGV